MADDISKDEFIEDARQNPEPKLEQNPLPEDNDRPAAPPDKTPVSSIEETHQMTDSNIDETEAYNEGITEAAEAELPDEDTDPIR